MNQKKTIYFSVSEQKKSDSLNMTETLDICRMVSKHPAPIYSVSHSHWQNQNWKVKFVYFGDNLLYFFQQFFLL